MKKCPFCAEEIQDDAIRCKHCGSWLDGRPQGQEVTVTKISPAAELSAPIQKSKGSVTFVGWLGILIGSLMFVLGLLGSIPLAGVGIFFVIASFLWARR